MWSSIVLSFKSQRLQRSFHQLDTAWIASVRNAAAPAFRMSPQNAAAQLLNQIVDGVIPQSAKEQGMAV